MSFVDALIAKLPYVFGEEIEYFRNLGASLALDSKVIMLGVGPGEQALLLYEGAEQAGHIPKLIDGQKIFFEFWCVDNASLGTYVTHMTSVGYNPGYMLNYLTDDIYHVFKDEFFDLLIIDACHQYECVKRDIQHYWPKLKYGGTLLLHDYVPLELDNGVAQAIAESITDEWEKITEVGISIVYRKVKAND